MKPYTHAQIEQVRYRYAGDDAKPKHEVWSYAWFESGVEAGNFHQRHRDAGYEVEQVTVTVVVQT